MSWGSVYEKNRDGSFADKVRSGWTKEKLMEYYELDEVQYDKVIAEIKKGEK